MYAKTKELGPVGGMRRARPPRSANACLLKITNIRGRRPITPRTYIEKSWMCHWMRLSRIKTCAHYTYTTSCLFAEVILVDHYISS